MSARRVGNVKWFDESKGYGFITADTGEDVFVHFTALRGDGFRTIRMGAPVEFVVDVSPRGLRAIDVVEL